MTFADMVLARHLLKDLDRLRTERILDALEGHLVELSSEDYTAIRALARAVRYELGDEPAAMEIDAIARRAFLN